MEAIVLPRGVGDAGEGGRPVWIRPWDGRDEMELFSDAGASAAVTVTALLSRCVCTDPGGTPVDPDFARFLTVGERESLLLQVRRITVGDALPCILTCPECEEKMELDLRTGDLLVPPGTSEEQWHTLTVETAEGTEQVSFRLPTGADQEAVAAAAGRDPEAAARDLAERCLAGVTSRGDVDGGADSATTSLSPTVVEQLSHRMAELDPQAEIRIDVECPECGAPSHTLLDTFAYICAETRRSLARLRQEIHLLAFHYHWSEREILAMTGTRRRAYVEHLVRALEAQRAS